MTEPGCSGFGTGHRNLTEERCIESSSQHARQSRSFWDRLPECWTPASGFKHIILCAVLNDVSPIVARVIAVPEDLGIGELHELFLSMLGWTFDPGFIIRIHAQEFNSFQRRSRGKRLRDFKLRRQEKFLYVCDALDLESISNPGVTCRYRRGPAG